MLLLACAPPQPDTGERITGPLVVQLRWVGGSTLLDWTQAQAGLWWSLSSLGALPTDPDALTPLTQHADTVTFSLDLGAVGFPESSLPAVSEAIAGLQTDLSVDRHGGVDLGRFLMRTLHEPWRYYAITGACAEESDWAAAHLDPSAPRYAVTDSLLVDDARIIELNDRVEAVAGIGFRAAELSGPPDGDHTVEEHEVIDVMPNGRQRYAVYDLDGQLQPASDPAISPAGQPGRCLWCHEGSLMIGQPNPPVDGYWTYEAFSEALAEQNTLLAEHRSKLGSLVGFEERDAHTWGELLVEEFLAPTPARVALEWGLPESAVRALEMSAHENEEYPELGEVYVRAEVDATLEAREGWRPVATLDSGRALDPHTAVLAPATLRDCAEVR